MHASRMQDWGIDRHPAISTSPCVRNGRMLARDRGPSADAHALPARAAPLRVASAETRCRA
eukprot:4451225-Prymnesium_polylepis.1